MQRHVRWRVPAKSGRSFHINVINLRFVSVVRNKLEDPINVRLGKANAAAVSKLHPYRTNMWLKKRSDLS